MGSEAGGPGELADEVAGTCREAGEVAEGLGRWGKAEGGGGGDKAEGGGGGDEAKKPQGTGRREEGPEGRGREG